MFKVKNNEVEKWFYKGQNLKIDRDFFDSRVTEYTKGFDFSTVWDEEEVKFDGVWDGE